MTLAKKQSHSWWFNSHKNTGGSPWLRSTLSELDEKTKAMLELIDEDADSFAQCAEMFYKKRPELVNMVEDLYRAHCSLAKQYDQLKLRSLADKSFKSSTDSFETYESEVDDPEQETEVDSQTREVPNDSGANDEAMKSISEEMERLKVENCVLKAELKARDDDKREVIRQLSLSICMLKEENVGLRKCIKDSRNWVSFEFQKLKKIFTSKFLG